MLIVLLVACLIPVIYLGYLVSRFDSFVESGGFVNANGSSAQVLVVGDTELAKQIVDALRANDITTALMTQPHLFKDELTFDCLVALFENDVDNILTCRIGYQVYSVEHIISLCNDRKTEWSFKRENIPYLFREGITPQIIVQSVLREIKKIA